MGKKSRLKRLRRIGGIKREKPKNHQEIRQVAIKAGNKIRVEHIYPDTVDYTHTPRLSGVFHGQVWCELCGKFVSVENAVLSEEVGGYFDVNGDDYEVEEWFCKVCHEKLEREIEGETPSSR